MRLYDDNSTTTQQYEGDTAIARWRQCDDTMATVRYDYHRIVVIILSRFRIVAIVLSHFRNRTIALSHCRYCTIALSPSYNRIVAIVLSHYRIVVLWISICNHDCPNGIPYSEIVTLLH